MNTQFGQLTDGTTDEKISIARQLGTSIVRMSTELVQFDGKSLGFERFDQAGIKVVMNLNYKDVKTVDGEKIPNAFLKPEDMTMYRAMITAVLTKYKPLAAVIENEPTTDSFHSGPIEDYINMLKNAVSVCKLLGVPVADGAIHPYYILKIMAGKKLRGNALDVKKLIEAYENIPLDFVNIHIASGDDVYPAGEIAKICDYLRKETGHEIFSNEWHLDNTKDSLMKSMVKEIKLGDIRIAINYSGSNVIGKINEGGMLTPLGYTYKDSISV